MSGITVVVGGTDYTEIACETLSFSKRFEVGDASASWTMPFPKYVIPGDYTTVYLYDTDSSAEIWRGRFRWELPDWDGCAAITQCQPEGLAASLTDEVFHESIQYGPQIKKPAAPPTYPSDVLLGSVIALNIADAVNHVVGALCPSVTVGTVNGSGIAIAERTTDFFHKNALTVIKAMQGLSAYLATPLTPKVHLGVFSFTTMPGSARYRVTLGDAVKVGIRRSPENVANRVGIGYGRHQGVTSPATLSYADIPIIRDKAVDLSGGSDVSQEGIAQQVADGVYARGLDLKNGWTYTVEIKRVATVYDTGLAANIQPYLIEPGEWLDILSLDHASFTKHPVSPVFITDVQVDHNLTVRLTCGETRSQEDAAAMRWQLAQAEPLGDATASTLFPAVAGVGQALPMAGPKYDKNGATGGGSTDLHLETGPLTTVQQPPPWNGTLTTGHDPRGVDPAYSTERKVLPQELPGNPPAVTFGLSGVDLQTAGVRLPINVVPVRIVGWSIDCSESATFAVKLYALGTGVQLGTTYALAGGTAKTIGAYTIYTTGYQALGTPIVVDYFDRLVPVVDTPAPGISDDAVAAFHLHLDRTYPGYPDVKRDPTDAADFIIDVPFGIGKDAA